MRATAVAVVLLMIVTGCANRKAFKSPSPPLDQSTPNSAALSYYEALERGDAATAKRVLLVMQRPGDAQYVDVMADLADVHRQIRDAAVAQYGAPPAEIERWFMMMRELLGNSDIVRRSEVREEGGHAEIRRATASRGDIHTVLSRQDGKWYVVVPESFRSEAEGTEQFARDHRPVVKALRDVAPAIRAGRHATLKAASEAYMAKLMESAPRAYVED